MPCRKDGLFITHVRNVAAAGADDRLIALVDALTERPGEPERSYLARCAAEPIALRIKRADIADTFDTAQRADLTDVQRRDLLRRVRRRLGILESFASAERPPAAYARRAT